MRKMNMSFLKLLLDALHELEWKHTCFKRARNFVPLDGNPVIMETISEIC